jgi:hypothetical protein
MHKARAKTPSWLLVLSGHGSGASGDDDGLPWCSLCLRKGAEAADGAVNTIGEDDKGNDGGDERGDDLGDPVKPKTLNPYPLNPYTPKP